MTDPWPRWSPAWWAAWTCALHRPGRIDDEEIPDAVREGAGPQSRSAAAPRPDWPTTLAAQCGGEPAPTDACALHGGRCSGACGGDEVARTARGRWWYTRTMRREGAGE